MLLASTHGDKGKFCSYAEVSHKNAEILNSFLDDMELFTSEEMELMHKLYDAVPERDTLIHGDFHTRNIFISDGELLLIDMADTSTDDGIVSELLSKDEFTLTTDESSVEYKAYTEMTDFNLV